MKNIYRLIEWFRDPGWFILRLAQATPEITPREIKILEYRWEKHLTQTATAKKLKISRHRAKEIEERALEKIGKRWDSLFEPAVKILEDILDQAGSLESQR
jgi:DNA-binding XRE family transcriptional regulator